MIDAYTRKGSGKSLKIFLIRMLSNTKKGLSYIFSQPQQLPKKNFPKKLKPPPLQWIYIVSLLG